jgi:hypothetical protein
MIKELFKKYSSIKLFSPAGFLVRGIEIILIFFILDLAGGKEYLGVIFGTVFTGGAGSVHAYFLKFFGAAYGAMYFLSVFLAPPLIIGSAVFKFLDLKLGRK